MGLFADPHALADHAGRSTACVHLPLTLPRSGRDLNPPARFFDRARGSVYPGLLSKTWKAIGTFAAGGVLDPAAAQFPRLTDTSPGHGILNRLTPTDLSYMLITDEMRTVSFRTRSQECLYAAPPNHH